MIKTSKNVKAGMMTNCALSPMMKGFGERSVRLKSAGFKSNATPNMIKPIKIFINNKVIGLKLS